MTTWQCLTKELDSWSAAGKTATFWWRDDDAAAPTPQLERLLRHAQCIPLALAVIPNSMTPSLVERLKDISSIVVLQHGWAHSNHACTGRSEYPSSRSEEDVSRELAAGRRVLVEHFGGQSIAVFVPPWHGFDERFLPLLPQQGITWISRKGPRSGPFAAQGLLQVNTHASPIRWTVPPSFGDDDEYLSIIVDHLRGRRAGRYDPAEPTGLLTHHLVQNDRSYEFISRLIDVISQHPGGKWLDGRDVFYSGKGGEANSKPFTS